MFNRDDESEDSSDVSIDDEPEFAEPPTPPEPEPIDPWEPIPYPDERRGLCVKRSIVVIDHINDIIDFCYDLGYCPQFTELF